MDTTIVYHPHSPYVLLSCCLCAERSSTRCCRPTPSCGRQPRQDCPFPGRLGHNSCPEGAAGPEEQRSLKEASCSQPSAPGKHTHVTSNGWASPRQTALSSVHHGLSASGRDRIGMIDCLFTGCQLFFCCTSQPRYLTGSGRKYWLAP